MSVSGQLPADVSRMAGVRAETSPPRGRSRNSRREERAAYLFMLPWFAGLAAFLIIPLGTAIWYSMTNERIYKHGSFVGLQNYQDILSTDDLFRQALYVTLKWLVLTIPLYLGTGLLLSLLLNQKVFGIHLFRTILYIPAVLSGVAVAVLWLQLLNPELGAINYILVNYFHVANPPYWLQDPAWAMPAVALMGLWGVGGSAVIYLAGLQNIPPHLYEAASIDGAGHLAKFRHITLPMLSPTIFFLLINSVIDSLLIFGPVFVLSAGAGGGDLGGLSGPNNSLLFYMLYLYYKAFFPGQGYIGYSSALAWILTLVGCALVYLMFRFEKRFVYYESNV